jgi:hypothetical protein
MRTRIGLLGLALVGVLVAASLGYAAYLASRDSVGLPVTKLETKPRDLAPTVAHRARPATTATSHEGTTTADDHGGGGSSGHGGGDD